MADKCEHIFGFEAVLYEGGWLVEEKDGFMSKLGPGGEAVHFDFCPLCGERLTDAT